MKILCTILTEKKKCFGPIRSLIHFYQQIVVISSQNNLLKYVLLYIFFTFTLSERRFLVKVSLDMNVERRTLAFYEKMLSCTKTGRVNIFGKFVRLYKGRSISEANFLVLIPNQKPNEIIF